MGKVVSILIFWAFVVTDCPAQGVLKRLPKPTRPMMAKANANASPVTISAWRLTAPIAGFMYPQQQLVTGIGYGYQRLHWVDSTQRYYTDFSISGVIYLGGDVNTSVNPNNILSIGISLGTLNQLVMVGPCYNLPKNGVKGSIGIVFNVSMPLN